MKTLFALLALATFSTTAAEARDSTWLLCDNGGLVLNVLEHRVSIDDRTSELTLIYGSHVYEGFLFGTYEGEIKLTSARSKGSMFDGRLALDFAKNTATIRGDLFINGEKFAISEKLPCKELEGKL